MKAVCRAGMLEKDSSMESFVPGLQVMGRTYPEVPVCMCTHIHPFLTTGIPDFQFSDHWRQDLYTTWVFFRLL